MKIKENICPIGNTTDLFNRKWIFCIMNNIFGGAKHFNEFKQANPTISNHVLSQTLKYMEENGLITKIINDNNDKNKTEYHLTNKGLKANKILYELALYSLEELEYKDHTIEEKEEIKEYYKKILRIK